MYCVIFLAAGDAVQEIKARVARESTQFVLWRESRYFVAHAAMGVARSFLDGARLIARLVFAVDNDGIVIGGAAKLYPPVDIARFAVGITARIYDQ